LAMAVFAKALWQEDGGWYVTEFIGNAAVALAVAAGAALAVPRQLGASLLAGWAGTAVAASLFYATLLEGSAATENPRSPAIRSSCSALRRSPSWSWPPSWPAPPQPPVRANSSSRRPVPRRTASGAHPAPGQAVVRPALTRRGGGAETLGHQPFSP
jgi:hypothetical protein